MKKRTIFLWLTLLSLFISFHLFVLAFCICLKNPFLSSKPPDMPKILREMPESISWLIISVQSDTLSRRIICSQAWWRPIVMPEISWHVINCEWLAEDKQDTMCIVPAITLHVCTEHIYGISLTGYIKSFSTSEPVHLPPFARLLCLSPQGSTEVLNCKQPG